MKAIVWRKSVYDNDFRCSHCGEKLFNVQTNHPTLSFGVDLDNPNHVHCMKCGTMVAVLKDYSGGEAGKCGEWDGDLE